MSKAIIENIPRLRLKALAPFLKKYEEVKDSVKGIVSLDGTLRVLQIDIKVSYFPEGDKFVFCWNYEGQDYSQTIKLYREPSNLVKGSSVLWLLCPYSGRKTRTLYTDLRKYFSRGVIKHIYRSQTQSRLQRLTDGNIFSEYWDTPERNRKEYYRDKITPYGKKRNRQYYKLIKAYGLLLKEL